MSIATTRKQNTHKQILCLKKQKKTHQCAYVKCVNHDLKNIYLSIC
jgi:hypothetical protein